jgi:hypothetical protein
MDAAAVDGWAELEKQAPGPLRDAWDILTRAPMDRTNAKRQWPLMHDLGRRVIGGKELVQWQYEVTGAGRIWYCPDEHRQIVWITRASCGHPKETD